MKCRDCHRYDGARCTKYGKYKDPDKTRHCKLFREKAGPITLEDIIHYGER